MIKSKKFSVYYDLIIFIFLKTISIFSLNIGFLKNFYDISITNIPNILLSFSILFFAFGLIIFFFHKQFTKLANIAEEIEEDLDIKK